MISVRVRRPRSRDVISRLNQISSAITATRANATNSSYPVAAALWSMGRAPVGSQPIGP